MRPVSMVTAVLVDAGDELSGVGEACPGLGVTLEMDPQINP